MKIPQIHRKWTTVKGKTIVNTDTYSVYDPSGKYMGTYPDKFVADGIVEDRNNGIDRYGHRTLPILNKR